MTMTNFIIPANDDRMTAQPLFHVVSNLDEKNTHPHFAIFSGVYGEAAYLVEL